MDYIDLGRGLERLALGLAVATVLLALWAVLSRDRRFVVAARHALIGGGFAAIGAATILVVCFFNREYGLEYVFSYSEKKLAAPYKFAGLWAGLQGSILFWASLLGSIGAVLGWSFRKRGLDPSGRRLEPFVYIVFATVQTFFLAVICVVKDPFEPISQRILDSLYSRAMESGVSLLSTTGMPMDGSGLNPLLENYWMTIHPPSVYLGFILYTVPFAFGMAALISGEFTSYWIRTTRRWTMIAWLFNTNGVILGGLWAYEVLGWGGYWAWDPVENASFLPWLASTAFLHSVMIQERRDMLRVWNAFLIALTFLLSIFGTYLTRSGIVSSVHAFSSGDVGEWFFWFLMFLIAMSMFFIFFRMTKLRSANSVDSALSREGVFLLNNMVLVSIAAAIVVLTLWPKISFELFGKGISIQVPVYNLVCTPFFILLLALTAIGPGTAWVRTSWRTLSKNLLLPALASIPLAVGTQYLAYQVIRGGDGVDPLPFIEHVYPTFIVTYLGWLIISSLAWEIVRTVRNVTRATGAAPAAAFLRLMTKANRRYGGYIVHAGLAMLAIGVVNSSMYRVVTEVRIADGASADVGPYRLDVRGIQIDKPVSAYLSTAVTLDVSIDGSHLATLTPEKRFYPVNGFRMEPTTTTEVQILRRPGEDFYVYFERMADGGDYKFTIFRSPLISLVWLGWIIMIAGGLWAAAPLAKRRLGLAG